MVPASSEEFMFIEETPDVFENIVVESELETLDRGQEPAPKSRKRRTDVDDQFAALFARASEVLAEAPPPVESHSGFFQMVRESLDELSPDECEDVKLEVLLLLRNRVKQRKQRKQQ